MRFKTTVFLIGAGLALLGAGCGQAPQPATTDPFVKTAGDALSPARPASADKTSYPILEIAKHAQASDCWMIIAGKVYDVTPYVSNHPGGNMIVSGCGKEATTIFGQNPKHAEAATKILEQYFIGILQQ